MIKNINVPENWKVSGNSGASSIQHVPIAPKDVIGDLDVVVNNKGGTQDIIRGHPQQGARVIHLRTEAGPRRDNECDDPHREGTEEGHQDSHQQRHLQLMASISTQPQV